ncbi:enoyl-CoA hydratase-related protein [Marinobacterium sedimentorum]|uniref:enoyl-CoA hydratase-related protein n=1 Tax=Marinobacterium sedimentorum TaxID=2927804 RepID=UPI0020C5D42C|nr:enoyl-CoA hydratase-related protein [Marinobacterium sedimentorum]MCP8690086.1 enoyl-CoA hydratase-related protein [Marinobacterium sedimentorum]
MSELITHQCVDGVLELSLNRPQKKNALNRAMYLSLTEMLQQADSDDAVRVILISGTGDSFCSGNDIADFISSGGSAEAARVPLRLLQTLAGLEKPLVAAIHGHAVGIGTTLLLHCDLVYGADNTRLQLPFARLGLVPEGGSSLLLPQLAGHRKAFELLVLGEAFDADCGRSIGLINEVTGAEQVLTRARDRACALAALPQQALRKSKQMLRAHQQDLLQQVLVEEIDAFRERLNSAEAQGALMAFMQRG